MEVGFLPYTSGQTIGCKVGRTKLVVSTGDGLKLNQFIKNMKLYISAVWTSKSFPQNTDDYQEKIMVIRQKLPADAVIVVENEPNYNEDFGNVDTYFKMLEIVSVLFPNHEVRTGGLTYPALGVWAMNKYIAKKQLDKVQVYKDAHMAHANAASVAFISALISKIQASGLRIGHNFHLNVFPESLSTLPLTLDIMKEELAGDIICGECSFRAQDPAVVTFALATMKEKGVKAVILADGTGDSERVVDFTDEMKEAVKAFL